MSKAETLLPEEKTVSPQDGSVRRPVERVQA